MQHNSNTEFVMYVDNFLSIETLESLQETFLNINYSEVKNPDGQVYGYRHTFPHSFHTDPLLQLIKNYFFPNRNLESFGDSSERYTLNIFYKDA
jgi:hypothetical protein